MYNFIIIFSKQYLGMKGKGKEKRKGKGKGKGKEPEFEKDHANTLGCQASELDVSG